MSEIFPLFRIFFTKGFLVFTGLLLVLFFAAWYNSGQLAYAYAKVSSAVGPAFGWILFVIFGIVYGQRLYSKWLYLQELKSENPFWDKKNPYAVSRAWELWNRDVE